MNKDPLALWRSFKFLFVGPAVLALLFVVNLMASPHHWWFHWAALGIGIAWVISFLRVAKAALLLGGLAALVTFLKRRN